MTTAPFDTSSSCKMQMDYQGIAGQAHNDKVLWRQPLINAEALRYRYFFLKFLAYLKHFPEICCQIVHFTPDTVAKRIYIAVIFLANLLLLVHTVVPHHHHLGMPHFVLFETHSHDSTGNDCCCTHGDEKTCAFEQDLDAIYKQSEENCSCASCVLHHPDMFLQTAVYPVFIYDFSLVREIDLFLEPPYLISYYCDYAGSGWGLRAPPVDRLSLRA